MCTVTLRCGAGSLLLTMNRDERFERAPEEAPRRIPGEPGRPSWLAPFDSASGGTWIGVNERGVVSCVLNGYEPSDEALWGNPSVPSRGSIIPRILEGQDGVGPARLPEALDFSAYPSFTLLVASKDGGEILRWRRGAGLARDAVIPGVTFLTSSSWREPDVAVWRSRAFAAWREAGEPETHGLPTFHLLAPDGDEASAPFMTRRESATRSVTQVQVDGSRGIASLTWWPRHGLAAIDPASPAATLDLELAASTALIADDGRV
jgi:transport and Golgi organization protein 2